MTRSSPFYLFTDFILSFIKSAYSPEDYGIRSRRNIYHHFTPKTDLIYNCSSRPELPIIGNHYVAWCGLSQYFKNIWEDLWNIKLLFHHNNCCFPLDFVGFRDGRLGQIQCEASWIQNVSIVLFWIFIAMIVWILLSGIIKGFLFALTSVIARLFYFCTIFIIRFLDISLDFLLRVLFIHMYRGRFSNDQVHSSSLGPTSTSTALIIVTQEPVSIIRGLIAGIPFEEESTDENVSGSANSGDQSPFLQMLDITLPPDLVSEAHSSNVSLSTVDKPTSTIPISKSTSLIETTSSKNVPSDGLSDSLLTIDKPLSTLSVSEVFSSNVSSGGLSGSSPTTDQSLSSFAVSDPASLNEPILSKYVPFEGSSSLLPTKKKLSSSVQTSEPVSQNDPSSSDNQPNRIFSNVKEDTTGVIKSGETASSQTTQGNITIIPENVSKHIPWKETKRSKKKKRDKKKRH